MPRTLPLWGAVLITKDEASRIDACLTAARAAGCELYLRRANMEGFDQEAFYAAYMAATLAPEWETRCAELLSTWESRPRRLCVTGVTGNTGPAGGTGGTGAAGAAGGTGGTGGTGTPKWG